MSFFTFYRPTAPLAPERPSISILVFKTNIRSILDIRIVEEAISKLEGVMRWNVDRDDIDNVLRIETTHPDPAQVIDLVRGAGFLCEELPD
jgi:hypothetical protein